MIITDGRSHRIAKAIKFLKEKSIDEFYSTKAIAKKFQLSPRYVQSNLMNYFTIAKNEQYCNIKKNEMYLSGDYLMSFFSLSRSGLDWILDQCKIPYIMLHNMLQAPNKKNRINVKRFYKETDLIKKLPNKYKQLLLLKFDKKEIDCYAIPKDLTRDQFMVYCGLIKYKIETDLWPNYNQLSDFILRLFQIKYSAQKIFLHIKILIEKKYITREYNNRLTTYKIYRQIGPLSLIYVKRYCIDIYNEKKYLMYAPRDFYCGE